MLYESIWCGKRLSEVATFIKVDEFFTSLFIDNVKNGHLYVVWHTNYPNNTLLRYNPMHPLHCALAGLYMPVRVTCAALVAHGYNYETPSEEPRSTGCIFFNSECPSGTVLLTLYWMAFRWHVSRARRMLFYWPWLLYPY